MFKSIIKQAENLGTSIAKTTSTDKSARKEALNDFLGLKKAQPAEVAPQPKGSITYVIRPFRDNDF